MGGCLFVGRLQLGVRWLIALHADSILRTLSRKRQQVGIRLRNRGRKRSQLWGCRLRPTAQHLGNTPCLRDAAAWREGVFRVANFADRSHAGLAEVVLKALQE